MSVDTSAPVWTSTYEEARARVALITRKIIEIDAQLTAAKPIDQMSKDGWSEYQKWRKKAVRARAGLLNAKSALRVWMKGQTPPSRPMAGMCMQDGSLRHTLASRLDELGIDYTRDELQNLKRRIAAEQAIDRIRYLLIEMIEEFEVHDPCGIGCSACELLARAEQEAQ